MSSPYQEFVRKARERFEARKQTRAKASGQYVFTRHAEYKMKQYGLSEQKVRGVIRHPKRREEGIVKNTIAVMQPVSLKKVDGKPARPGDRGRSGGELWKQEIWVMYTLRDNGAASEQRTKSEFQNTNFANRRMRIISAWRYPGVSPKRHPIPEDILLELEREDVWEG